MTLDEAIKHCKEVAKQQEVKANELYKAKDFEESRDCIWCSKEHEQLAEWLKELKDLKDLKEHSVSFQKINELAKFAIDATGQSDEYSQGMCNGIEYMRGTLTNTHCNFFGSEVTE